MPTSYGQFCAVARALEVLGQRWTLLVVREVLSGSTRFNDIRRGIPLIPRSTLVDRLAALERADVLRRTGDGAGYELTEAGLALAPVLASLAQWAHGWDRRGLEPQHLDPEVLLWDIQRRLDPDTLPTRRTVVEFVVRGRGRGRRGSTQRLWLHVERGRPAELCRHSEGFEADAVVEADAETLARWWLGELRWADARRSGALTVTAPPALERALPKWFLGYAFPPAA